MQKYNSLEVVPERYEKIKTTQIQNNTRFNEHRFGSRKNLYVENVLIASSSVKSMLDIGSISNRQFVSFLGAFNKQLYSRIREDESLLTKKITFRGISKDKNITAWKSLKTGSFFYNIDLVSAYWQMALRLGYISRPFFERYRHLDSYKQAKRYCISFLARSNSMVYSNGVEIKCDISPLQLIYDNIRNELYRCVSKCLKDIPNYIEYNIDGVSVLASDMKEVKKQLREMELEFKINECVKINDTEYSYKGFIKKFCNLPSANTTLNA